MATPTSSSEHIADSFVFRVAARREKLAARLALDRHGIPIPTHGQHILPAIVPLPLLAFDPQGFRLGYGGGYFDRTLATLVPRPLAIGVGFELAQVVDIRAQTHDIRLDVVVIDTGIVRRA